MHWTDNAIILSARKHGETSAVGRVFSEQHGVYGGVIRGVHSKTNRGIIQSGNVVNATWNARLSEQLGSLKCELLEANAAQIMQDSARLSALTSACALIESALPERHPYPRIYGIFHAFLTLLTHDIPWQEAYALFELELLADTGFGLDLSSCAATGKTEELIYVSPKSGRAVCREAGEPYRERLLALPGFLKPPSLTLPRIVAGEGEEIPSPVLYGGGGGRGAALQETLAGLRLTGYFLDHWLLGPHNRKLPAARGRLIQTLQKTKAPHATEV